MNRPFSAEYRTDAARQERPRWERGLLWTGVVLLAGAVGGLYWFGANDRGVWRADLSNLRSVLTTMSERTYRIEQHVREGDQPVFRKRLGNLESTAAAARLRSEFSQQNEGIQTRLAQLERRRMADQTQLASLEGELSRVSAKLARYETRMATAGHNSTGDQEAIEQTLEQRIASISRGITSNQRDLDRIARGLPVRRVDFEAIEDHRVELAPGITLHVTGINTARRQVEGWIWILPDRKMVWLQRHGAREPVVFYSKRDGKQRKIVFTHITNDSVVGYALLPGSGQAGGARDRAHTSGSSGD